MLNQVSTSYSACIMLILSVGQKLIYVPFLFCLVLVLVLVLLLRLEIFGNGVWEEFYHWKILLHMVLLYQGKNCRLH